MRGLEAAYNQLAQAVQLQDVDKSTAAFAAFGQALNAVDGTLLAGHPRMLWKEFSMLLGNDAAEGHSARQLADVDRVFLTLKGHMRRTREQLGILPGETAHIERLAVSPDFQAELARVWRQYLALGQSLAADDLPTAQASLEGMSEAVASIGEQSLASHAQDVWADERSNLIRLIARLKNAQDIQTLRSEFSPLSQEIGVLAKTFGFGEADPIFELHCPMAFQGKGAVWYQNSDQTRNPYFGSTMLKCADRVDRIEHELPPMPDVGNAHENHSQH
jgi:Cu(I)/Ag(I) efflux system membrane fusion protein